MLGGRPRADATTGVVLEALQCSSDLGGGGALSASQARILRLVVADSSQVLPRDLCR